MMRIRDAVNEIRFKYLWKFLYCFKCSRYAQMIVGAESEVKWRQTKVEKSDNSKKRAISF